MNSVNNDTDVVTFAIPIPLIEETEPSASAKSCKIVGSNLKRIPWFPVV